MSQQEKETLLKNINDLPEDKLSFIAGWAANELEHTKQPAKASA